MSFAANGGQRSVLCFLASQVLLSGVCDPKTLI